jgi:hypothetical protein
MSFPTVYEVNLLPEIPGIPGKLYVNSRFTVNFLGNGKAYSSLPPPPPPSRSEPILGHCDQQYRTFSIAGSILQYST